MQRIAHLLVATALAAVATAQNVTLPNGTAATEGNTSNAFPWGRGGTGLLIQNIYDSTNFTNQGVTFPILINRLKWRPDAAIARTWVNCSYNPATIKLSTCPLDQAAPSNVFANNRGGDVTTVFSGLVSYTAGTSTPPGPAPFLVDVPLTTPFLYDPSAGDLNIETDLPVGSFTGTSGLQFDVQSTGSLSCRVYLSTGYPVGNGIITANHGVVVDVGYTPAVGYAQKSLYGAGCYNIARSVYEFFATAGAFDLANSSLSMIYNGTDGYTVVPGINAYVAPSGGATVLALTDDSETTVTLGSTLNHPGGSTGALTVCSNGYVSTATGNGVGFTPAVAGWLAFARTNWSCWHDFNPAAVGSGTIKFEEVGSVSYVTWDGVYDFGGTTAANANTLQMQFDRSNGNVHVVWGTMSVLGNGFLVGFKVGGPVLDPGNRDISATLPGYFTAGVDQRALALNASARPIINTTINLVTSNFPPVSVLGANILSFTQYAGGIDLTGLGMAGCFQYVGLDSSVVLFPVSGTASNALGIPNNNALSGLHVYSQSAAFAPGANILGVTSSNGTDLGIGIL